MSNLQSPAAPRPKLGGTRPGAGRKPKNHVKTSISPAKSVSDAWEKVAAKLGFSKTTVFELAMREYAVKNGVEVADQTEATQ